MKKTISIALAIIAILGIIYIYSNSLKVNGKISYSATNEVASVKISRFTDYDEFLKAKSSSIILYDERSELNNVDVFIAGEVDINYDFYRKDAEYKLECIKKNGESFSGSLMATREAYEDNTLNIPFFAYDFNNSINGALEKAIITRDGNEITVLKLDKL